MVILVMLAIVLFGIVSYIFYLNDEINGGKDPKDNVIDQDPIKPVVIKEEIKPVINNSKSKYQQYLKTDYWKKRRLRALRLAEYKCQLCGKKNVLFNVHHNTYNTLYHEKDCDLIVLCNECHKRYHQK